MKTPTSIGAELILASKNAATGDILYTFRLTYPRCLLSEFNTHRCMSRNTSSSRAIPMKTVRKTVVDDPFVPMYIGSAKKGMQAGSEIEGWKRTAIELFWYWGRLPAVGLHWVLEKLGAPKQITNRVLEPWLWVTQVVSATDWKNFLLLRTHKDAEPHLQHLAKQVAKIIQSAEQGLEDMVRGLASIHTDLPLQSVQPGQWHIPFITDDEWFNSSYDLETYQMISAARAARTSYTLVGSKTTDTEADIELGERLLAQRPLHASPLEHQAQARYSSDYSCNFKGWHQLRKTIENEHGGDRDTQQ